MSEADFAQRMVDMVNQRRKYVTEQKAKVKRDKPMTQTHQRQYMMNYLKNQGSWKIAQLKKLTDEELKEKFEYLMKSIKYFVPMDLEIEKASKKRSGVEIQTESSKKQRTYTVKDVHVTEEETKVAKEEDIEKPIKKKGKRRKLAEC